MSHGQVKDKCPSCFCWTKEELRGTGEVQAASNLMQPRKYPKQSG